MQLCSKVMECDWKKCQRNWFFFSIYTYLELLFLYFLYFIHSFFLFNIFKKEFTIFVVSLSLSLHKSFSIKLVWGAKKNLPNKPDRNKRHPLGLTKYLFMDGHYFFLSKKSPSNIDPCMAMSIFHNNTLVSLFFLSRCPSEK